MCKYNASSTTVCWACCAVSCLGGCARAVCSSWPCAPPPSGWSFLLVRFQRGSPRAQTCFPLLNSFNPRLPGGLNIFLCLSTLAALYDLLCCNFYSFHGNPFLLVSPWRWEASLGQDYFSVPSTYFVMIGWIIIYKNWNLLKKPYCKNRAESSSWSD